MLLLKPGPKRLGICRVLAGLTKGPAAILHRRRGCVGRPLEKIMPYHLRGWTRTSQNDPLIPSEQTHFFSLDAPPNRLKRLICSYQSASIPPKKATRFVSLGQELHHHDALCGSRTGARPAALGKPRCSRYDYRLPAGIAVESWW